MLRLLARLRVATDHQAALLVLRQHVLVRKAKLETLLPIRVVHHLLPTHLDVIARLVIELLSRRQRSTGSAPTMDTIPCRPRDAAKLVIIVDRTFHGALDIVVDAADSIVFELCAISAEHSVGVAAHYGANV